MSGPAVVVFAVAEAAAGVALVGGAFAAWLVTAADRAAARRAAHGPRKQTPAAPIPLCPSRPFERSRRLP